MRQVLVCPGEDGWWMAECPSLAGCISQGKTKEEAVLNVKAAKGEYTAALEEDNLPVPEDRFEAVLVVVGPSCRAPDHDELDRGTLRAIIRHAGLTVDQFLELL